MSDLTPPDPLEPKIQSLVSNAPPKPAPNVYEVGNELSNTWLWITVTCWWIATLIVAFVLGGKACG